MKGIKYLLTIAECDGEAVIEYSFKGFLRSAEITVGKNMSFNIFEFLWTNLPMRRSEIDEWQKNAPAGWQMHEMSEDLSFDRFWKEYGNKVGKKTMTENAWKKLSQADKMAALLFIPKLRTRKKLDGTQMPYPSTYLNQKYWEV